MQMLYRKNKYGEEISLLGYGCMRFTRKGNAIDLDKAEQEVMAAYRAGVNYFDTAYIYPGSEVALGEILKRNGIRDRVRIATKLPQYLIKSRSGIEKYFETHLKRLQTDHIDYYLMHMLTDLASWEQLKALGILDWIRDKKASGQIRNLGFSFHGNTDMFLKILDAYDWDFCQIQYNYLDENTQAGREGLMAASAKGIPVIIMEPLRGGRLVNLLPEKAKQEIAAHPRGYSAAEWAFRWLYAQPQVTCVLSGMNSLDMVGENVRIASDPSVLSFTEEDRAFLQSIRDEINRNMKVGCTGCGYCMPCPQGVDIPGTFRCYNRMATERPDAGRKEYFQTTVLRKESSLVSRCIGCGKCEAHCPQHIAIRQKLKEADHALLPLPGKIAAAAARFWMYGR